MKINFPRKKRSQEIAFGFAPLQHRCTSSTWHGMHLNRFRGNGCIARIHGHTNARLRQESANFLAFDMLFPNRRATPCFNSVFAVKLQKLHEDQRKADTKHLRAALAFLVLPLCPAWPSFNSSATWKEKMPIWNQVQFIVSTPYS